MSKRELSPAVEVMPEPKEPEDIVLLKSAKGIIAHPDNWTKGAECEQTWNGYAYCMLGAVGHVAGTRDFGPEPFYSAIGRLKDVVSGRISHFNDYHKTTHADVMAAFDLAIEQATKDWLAHR